MSSYAVIQTGSKQYLVEPNDVIEVEKIELSQGKGPEFNIDQVLLLKGDGACQVGTPLVKGAKVVCEYLGDIRGDKVISFRYRRRKSSKRKVGHRQEISRIKIKSITVA